jgi:hypothetical protein
MGPGPINEEQVIKAVADVTELLQQKYGLMLMPPNYWIRVGEFEHKKVIGRLEKAIRDVFEMDNCESF